MKNEIFNFETKTWLKTPLFYVLTTVFFLFSLVTMLGTGGFFDGPTNVTQNVRLLNSPYSLGSISFLTTKLLLFITVIFGGFGLYRDYKNKSHAILYSYPISKSYYLNGKLLSALLVLFIAGLVTILGLFIGEVMLGTDNPKIGTFNLFSYFTVFSFYLLSTILIIGVFVFVSVGITRNIFSGFIVVIGFVLFQIILENVFFNYKEIVAILDPFGQNAFHLATNTWNIETQNSSMLPINSYVIFNRILWTLLAVLAYYFFSKKFDFQYDNIWHFKARFRKKKVTKVVVSHQSKVVENINYRFSIQAKIKSCFQLMGYDFKSILKNWMFIILCLLGGLAVFFIQLKLTNTGEFNLFPLTRIFIGAPLGLYTLILIVSTFLFSGSLIHKAKKNKMNLMLDVTPVDNWQLIFSKIGAISCIQIVQLLLFLIVGIIIQTINGYYDFDLELYAFHLFVLVFPVLFVWNVTSHFIHSLFPNIFIGLFVLLAIWLGVQSLELIGVQTNILKYNTLPTLTYSDFNGYGFKLKGYLLLVLYWVLFGFILTIGTLFIWNRGSLSSIKERLKLAKLRMGKIPLFLMVLLSISFFWIGSKIYTSETNDKMAFLGTLNTQSLLKEHKQEWQKFSKITQPKITDVVLHINIYPKNKSFDATGKYTLINRSDKNMDTLFIRTGFDEITQLDWDGNAQLIKEDKKLKSYLYKLETPLLPGDSLKLDFSIKNTPNTIFSRNSNVITDGTFIKQDILPRLGYQFIEKQIPLTNSTANNYNFYHRDADYVNIKTTISTSKDQIAIAPGELSAKKTEKNRVVYQYITPKAVKFNFSFHSAKYEVLEETFKNASLQLYYKKGHIANARLMLDGLKAALEYNTKWFGTYPYQQIRIVEFPLTEESYSATLSANNIPTSEVLFSINSENMKEKINLPFYVLAHELTHEWFGNQLIPADAEGAKMLTESITEYISLNIYKQQFGEELYDNFLKTQYKRYERGRKNEKEKEQPLNKVRSHQEYISYGKGAIAFSTIANSIGPEKFNNILKDFILKYKFQLNYYPTSNDFIEYLKNKTKQENHKLIDYWLTEINEIKTN